MLCKLPFQTALVFAGSLWMLGANAGEAPPSNDADAKTRALEERVRVLEKRVAEMEARATQQNPVPAKRFGWTDNADELFDQMRREMMQNGGAFDLNNLFGQNPAPARRAAPGRKQMLGVGVDQVSDELKTRYKNEVKEGAFIISIYPNSPAERAGILVGDAITAFDGKQIADPQSLIDAVKTASKGDHEVVVTRRGESLMLKVHLTSQDPAPLGLDPNFKRDGPGAGARSRTDIHVSALELPGELAKELKLSDDQKKKMNDILATHAKALSDEFEQSSQATQRNGGVFSFSMQGNLNELAKKHADNAAKDLASVLNAEQLKQWNDYRSTHSSVSFSQSMQMNGAPGNAPAQEDDETISF